jgi:hypothetical protein
VRIRLPLLICAHLLASALVEALFARQFGHHPRVIASHILLVAEWDLALLLIVTAIATLVPGDRWPGLTYRGLLAITGTMQVYLYALSAVSNTSWGRNMTGAPGDRVCTHRLVRQGTISTRSDRHHRLYVRDPCRDGMRGQSVARCDRGRATDAHRSCPSRLCRGGDDGALWRNDRMGRRESR